MRHNNAKQITALPATIIIIKLMDSIKETLGFRIEKMAMSAR